MFTVQCAYHLGFHSVDEVEEDHGLEVVEEEEEDQMEEGGSEDMPTVLAEFSSVVADTQQYIVADHLAEGETQVPSSFVYYNNPPPP